MRAGRLLDPLLRQLRRAEILLPPLRERQADIPILARHFLTEACERYGHAVPAITAEWLQSLASWFWPGNVAELRRAIEQLVVESPEGGVDLSRFVVGDPGQDSPELDLRRRVEAFERGQILAALRAAPTP